MRFTGIPGGKGEVLAESVMTTIPTAFIFTRYFLFSMFYQFIKDTKFFEKNVQRRCTSKQVS